MPKTLIAPTAIGQIVQLKSGGPDMTVTGFEDQNNTILSNGGAATKVTVSWITDQGVPYTERFPVTGLTVIAEKDEPESNQPVPGENAYRQNPKAYADKETVVA